MNRAHFRTRQVVKGHIVRMLDDGQQAKTNLLTAHHYNVGSL